MQKFAESNSMQKSRTERYIKLILLSVYFHDVYHHIQVTAQCLVVSRIFGTVLFKSS